MDPLVIRILLTVCVWPVAIVLYLILFLVMEREIRDEYAFVWTGVGVGFVVCTWLISVWRSQIRWTPKRRYQTCLTIPAAASLGIIVGIVGNRLLQYDRGMFWCFGSLVALASWPVMAVLVWRERPEERALRTTPVSCPGCGYDLRGLSECRCPECGRQYTIDGLFAAQLRSMQERVVTPGTRPGA
jgi:hypothetical protein